ncbi:MAG: hypothetical protein ACKVS6_11560 [Planctomycetota bacterium]
MLQKGLAPFRRVGLFIFVALLIFAKTAGGTTVERLSLSEITSRAARIVELRIREIATLRDAKNRILTRYRAEILTNLKGVESKDIEWTSPGGTMGDETLIIPGIPNFSLHEEAILFLSEPSRSGIVVPIGLGQGAFRARFDTKRKKAIVKPDLAGLELLDPATGKRVETSAAEWEREIFINEIRRMVAR